MEELKKIIDELGINALETNMKIAGVAVVSDSGNLIFQTENWDLTNHTDMVLNVIKGNRSFVLSNTEFSVVESTTEGIIGTNNSGMGHVIFVPFQGGVLVSYAMPQADPPKALSFLKTYAMRLNGKV
ncbi:MAG: hypothetical protein JSV23_02375 [Promethearchaeota archaeon]|nr:MAG: hypothetical protein JSV23_02375 [Candidatus Lokiarchaeota archaeon]